METEKDDIKPLILVEQRDLARYLRDHSEEIEENEEELE